MKEKVFKNRKEMIEDLKSCNPQAFRLNNKDLEILYNNEFYVEFEGKVYVIEDLTLR